MEACFSKIFEDDRQERSMTLLLQLTVRDMLN